MLSQDDILQLGSQVGLTLSHYKSHYFRHPRDLSLDILVLLSTAEIGCEEAAVRVQLTQERLLALQLRFQQTSYAIKDYVLMLFSSF